MTFQEMQDEVGVLVIDTPARVVALIPGFLNEAMRLIQNRHGFFVMQAELEVNTVIGQRILAPLPARFKGFRNRPYRVSDLGRYREFAIAEESEARRAFSATAEGSPQVIAPAVTDDSGAGVLHVYPLPDGISDYPDGEYRVRVPYWRYVPTLTAPDQTNWFTENANRYLIYEATALAFTANENDDRAAQWRQLAGRSLVDARSADTALRAGHVDTLVPHRDGNAPLYRR